MRSDENYVKNTDGEDIGRYRFYNIVGAEEENGKYYMKLENTSCVTIRNNGEMFYEVMKVDLDKVASVPFKILNLGEK